MSNLYNLCNLSNLYICIMAGGRGSRMRSTIPKFLHRIHGKEMIMYILDAVAPLTNHLFVILSPDSVTSCLFLRERYPNLQFMIQPTPEGTGHAAQVFVQNLLRRGEVIDKDNKDIRVLLLNADTPFVSTSVLRDFVQQNEVSTVIGARLNHPRGYGRLVIKEQNYLQRIEEEKDCTDKENNLCNMGVYMFSWKVLQQHIFSIDNHNNANEYYLTNLFTHLPDNITTKVWMLPDEYIPYFQGINTPEELDAVVEQHPFFF